MSSQWTSKYAIMRDLSLAQGCDVPATIETTIGLHEKPPALDIKEETEEEYFGHYLGDGDTTTAPDIGLIQQMLEMVRDTDISSELEDEPDKIVQISKPHNTTKSKLNNNNNIDPKLINNNLKTNLPKKPKRKRENVAVNSLLEAMAGNTPILNMEKPPTEPLKLLKPTDFISTEKEIVDSVEKVNGWLNSQQIRQKNTKPSTGLLNWEPSDMFKRKSSSMVSNESDSANSSPPQKAAATIASYRPSTLADEYYKKYVERSKMKAIVNEDVWTRAERIMKEIDSKKKTEIEVIAESDAIEVIEISKNPPGTSDKSEEVKSLEMVQLPQQRHLLTGECVVCEVFKSRGFDVDYPI